jgi:hypothetical protein
MYVGGSAAAKLNRADLNRVSEPEKLYILHAKIGSDRFHDSYKEIRGHAEIPIAEPERTID